MGGSRSRSRAHHRQPAPPAVQGRHLRGRGPRRRAPWAADSRALGAGDAVPNSAGHAPAAPDGRPQTWGPLQGGPAAVRGSWLGRACGRPLRWRPLPACGAGARGCCVACERAICERRGHLRGAHAAHAACTRARASRARRGEPSGNRATRRAVLAGPGDATAPSQEVADGSPPPGARRARGARDWPWSRRGSGAAGRAGRAATGSAAPAASAHRRRLAGAGERVLERRSARAWSRARTHPPTRAAGRRVGGRGGV